MVEVIKNSYLKELADEQKVMVHCYYFMVHCTHNRFTNGIVYPLLLLLLLTCPMKREIKQSLTIPVGVVELAEINNHSLCINLVPETTSTVKQIQKCEKKQLFVPSISPSVALLATVNATRNKVYREKLAWGPSDLFIQYRKLLI